MKRFFTFVFLGLFLFLGACAATAPTLSTSTGPAMPTLTTAHSQPALIMESQPGFNWLGKFGKDYWKDSPVCGGGPETYITIKEISGKEVKLDYWIGTCDFPGCPSKPTLSQNIPGTLVTEGGRTILTFGQKFKFRFWPKKDRMLGERISPDGTKFTVELRRM